MEKCPLNLKKWIKFLHDELSPRDKMELIEHLDKECPLCEEFFHQLGAERCLVGLEYVGGKLLSNTNRSEISEHEKERIYRNVMAQVQVPQKLPGSFRRKILPAFVPAAAAALFLFVAVAFLPQSSNYVGIKGNFAEQPRVNLNVAVLKGADRDNKPQRAVMGADYHPNDILLFRYRLNSGGYFYLARLHEGDIEMLYPDNLLSQKPHRRGVYEFREGKKLQGIPLNGLEGKQVFVGLFSKHPVRQKRKLVLLAEEYLEKESIDGDPEKSFDKFEINVK